jgi:hypothetical protein
VTITGLLSSPIAQDPAYHLFADPRALLGIPNFWNVMSNLPFVIVGALGFRVSLKNTDDPLRSAWLVFFAGIFLTAFGSGYYHLAPDNETLAWDRLTMTIGFMSFVAIVIGEYLSVAWGRRLLVPLLAAGAASVFYWAHTESLGAGDLRPYALVQFLPMLLIPLVAIARRSRSDLGPYIAWMIAFYVAAKVAEHYDTEIFAAGNLLSGHSLKHIFAALAPACLLFGLRRRRRSPVSDFPE